MPTYEYECRKCGHHFEAFQSITAEPLKTCPKSECPEGTGGGRVRRLIGAGGGLLFKGSGFYITDYRSDSYKQAVKAESNSDSSGSSGARSSKSDGTSSGDAAKSTAKNPPKSSASGS